MFVNPLTKLQQHYLTYLSNMSNKRIKHFLRRLDNCTIDFWIISTQSWPALASNPLRVRLIFDPVLTTRWTYYDHILTNMSHSWLCGLKCWHVVELLIVSPHSNPLLASVALLFHALTHICQYLEHLWFSFDPCQSPIRSHVRPTSSRMQNT